MELIALKNRFEQVHFEKLPDPHLFKLTRSVAEMEIIKDLETGVLYCVAGKESGGLSMTPLIGADGQIVIETTD